MSERPNTFKNAKKTAGKKTSKSAKSAGASVPAFVAARAERAQEKKSVEGNKESFLGEERARFALLSANPSDENLDQFLEEDRQKDRQLFVDLVKFLQSNDALQSYLDHIEKLKKSQSSSWDTTYTVLTLLDFIKNSRELDQQYEEEMAFLSGPLGHVIGVEIQKFESLAQTFMTEFERITFQKRIENLQKSRNDRMYVPGPFVRQPGKYGPKQNEQPEKYQPYDYRNVSRFEQPEPSYEDEVKIEEKPFVSSKEEPVEQKPKEAKEAKEAKEENKNPLVRLFNNLERALPDEIYTNYIKKFKHYHGEKDWRDPTGPKDER